MSDLEQTILDSINDAELPPDPLPEATEDSSTEVVETPTEPEVVESEATQAPPIEVPSPTAKTDDTKVEDFDKKYGLTPQSSSGRPNRIPYDRVTKIVAKAKKDAIDDYKKEFEPKVAKATEYEAKVKDYEGRLTKVAEFERVMLNEQDKFLEMLASQPAYKPFFTKVADLLEKERLGTVGQPPTQIPTPPIPDDMPEPDQEFPDGSKVYSKDGLRKLLEWNASHAEDRAVAKVTEAFTKRFGPMETEWQQHQRIQTILPQINQQIADARQWPQFNENEQEITAALKANQRLSLEGAYRQVVFPKLVNDRNKIRQEVLAEVKQAKPTSTSTPVRPAKPTTTTESSGPRDLEDIIRQSLATLK